MTRAEYEKLYGVKPVFSATSTLEDETPAPTRMTRAEYNEIYYPTQTKQNGLGSQLVNRAKDVGDALWADKPSDLAPGRTALRIGGAVTGAAADIIGAALSPAIGKLVDTVSNIPAVQKFAMKKGTSKALDVANVATEVSQEEWKKFEEKNPVIAQDIRDVTNIASFIPVGKGAQVAGKGVANATEGIVPKVAKQLDERSVKNVVDEIAKIEDKYAGTRKANLYSKDVDASRARIAESNVLDGAVDTDGVIRTKTPGGVIDAYRAQTIDGLEDIVRKGLKESKETIPVTMVRQALVREIGKSGLEGADLVTALKKIDKELEGLDVRIKGSSIVDLSYLHDNKIATTKNINYLTPPEKSTYRKAVARAYQKLVQDNSKKVDVEGINKELSKYLDDIKRLERLDGARAEGGRLGKYTASMAGTLIGGAAGSVGGGVGAAVGGIVGGEAAAALKGLGMSRTFKGGGKGIPKSAVLEKARLSIPDKAIKAKAGVPKTKEITKLEKDIAKNVTDQKKAIAKGDFALVAALKEVYTALVEELKKAIKYLNENGSVGMSIRKTVTPESVAKRGDKADMKNLAKVLDDPENAKLDPDINRMLNDMGLGKATPEELRGFAKDTIDEFDIARNLTVKTDTLDPKNYKSAEEFVKAQGEPMYHGSALTFDEFDFDQMGGRGSNQGFGANFTNQIDSARSYMKTRTTGADGDWAWSKENAPNASLIEAYSKLENPIIITKKDNRTVGDIFTYEQFKKIALDGDNIAEGKKHFEDGAYYRAMKENPGLPHSELKKIASQSDFESNLQDYWNKLKKQYIDGSWNGVFLFQDDLKKLYSSKKQFLKKFVEETKYDGVIDSTRVDNRNPTPGTPTIGRGDKVTVVFDTSKIKTRTQLTEIWNKANRTTSATDK